MKHCLSCEELFQNEAWNCPRCGWQPPTCDGIVRFIEDARQLEDGFKPEYFAKLANFEADHFWFRARNRLLQWALGKYFPQMQSFFEVGCGTGFVLAGLLETMASIRLAGGEMFFDGLRFAKKRLSGVELFQMDARQIPFEDEFDVVGAFDVLEHIPEDELVLGQVFRAIKPGGGLVITVPQHPFLWSESDRHAMHQRRYRRTELKRKVERAGFRIRRVTSFVSLLLPLMILKRGMPRKRRDPWADFRIGSSLNASLESILSAEQAIIRAGVSFPAGGSLLLVAEKPVSAP